MSADPTHIDPSFWSDQLFDDGPEDGPDEMDMTPEARRALGSQLDSRTQTNPLDPSRSAEQTWRGG